MGVTLLVMVLLLTIFEGAARKWLFEDSPTLRYAAYFSKDICFVWAAILGRRRGRRFNLSWMGLCAGLILIPSAASSFANSNAVGTILAIRAYLVVPLCAFLAVPLVRSFRDVERCALAVAFSSLLVAALGVYQYNLPASHVLNRYDSSTEKSNIVAEGGHVRSTGTFSYIAGMAVMAGLGAWAGLVLVLPYPGRSKWLRQVGVAALMAALVCALVSMSRTALVVWIAVVFGALFLYMRASQSILLVLAVAMIVASLGLTNPTEQFETGAERNSLASGMAYRIQRADTFGERFGMVTRDLKAGIAAHPLGEGLGLGQPGGYSYEVKIPGGIEFEWGRIVFEVGVAGLVGALSFRFITALMCLRGLYTAADPARRILIAAALPFFGILSTSQMVFNHTGNTAAWVVMTTALAAVAATAGNTRPVMRGQPTKLRLP
jgi:hypothetical protein